MLRSPFVALVLLLPSLAACGGLFESDDSPSEPPDDTKLAGSYDAVFSGVRGQSSWIGTGFSSSAKGDVRIDLRAKAGGGFEALLTPRWGEPNSFNVHLDDRHAILTGEARISEGEIGNQYTDRWTVVTLDRRPDGALAGTFAVHGDGEVIMGDIGDSYSLDGNGSIQSDKTPPELRIEPLSAHGPQDQMLPWDSLYVRAAEGVPNLEGGLAATDLAWSRVEDSAVAWGGGTLARGTLRTWDQFGSLFPWLESTVADPSGNQTTLAPVKVDVLLIGPPVAGYDFDAAVPPIFGHWGDVTFLGGGGLADPVCERGGCAKLGPLQSLGCDGKRAGLAGLLRTDAGSQITVRYRVLYAKNENSTDGRPYARASVMGLDVAAHGRDVPTVLSTSDDADISPLATPLFGMEWATGWKTLRAPLGGGDENGFALYLPPQPGGCGSFPSMPASDVIVLVDAVTVEN